MSNISKIDLNLLRALNALLETQSVTRAAERLGLTQPAVSGMLARLRDTFQDPLFVRTQRGLRPTPRAEALTVPLASVLANVEHLLKPEDFDPGTAETTVHIAATDYAQHAIIVPFLSALRREAPGVKIAVQSVTSASFARQLEDRELDMALVTPDMAPDTLRARKLFEESYIGVVRHGHPALSEGSLSLESFCSLDHALMSHDGTHFQGATDAALAAKGLTRHVVATVPSFMILLEIVRNSDVCALVPGRLLEDTSGLTAFRPPIAIEGFTKLLVWHERVHSDPAHIWFRDRLARSLPGRAYGA
ncbi:LysR family transcriptional regulator [Salinicola rhizosphaerae]|uniref:Transcriptional regulator n=1 Tax=Salinicola rhizosphaerae TaxID=1443141 RepID=A0ABQ3DM88_9GAMM|nr:LysR family transcriptional regulator [Salinicola rhizosphaerae]GHB07600.1 transcriptional regulator [Salinicola rhizosphaerae]